MSSESQPPRSQNGSGRRRAEGDIYPIDRYRGKQDSERAWSEYFAAETGDYAPTLGVAGPRKFLGLAIEMIEAEADAHRVEVAMQAQREAEKDEADAVSRVHVTRAVHIVHGRHHQGSVKWRELFGALFLGGALSQLLSASFWQSEAYLQATVMIVGMIGALLVGSAVEGSGDALAGIKKWFARDRNSVKT